MLNGANKKLFGLLALFCVASLLLLSTGCNGKTDFTKGSWKATDVTIGDKKIDEIVLSVNEQKKDSSCVITSCDIDYELLLTINGEPVTDLSATYYRKELRLAFDWNNNGIRLSAVMRRREQNTYIDTHIILIENNSSFSQTSQEVYIILK